MSPSLNIAEEIDFSFFFGGAEGLPEPNQHPSLFPRRTEIPHSQARQNVYGSTPQDPSDFLWLMTEEPHRSRRRVIMKAHPEVIKAHVIGGTANHNLFLAIHEVTHSLIFKGVKPNKLLAIRADLPIGIPYGCLSWQGYHLEHHRYLGEDGIDVDLPTRLELSISFYALRPGFVRSQRPTYWHFIGTPPNWHSIFSLRPLCRVEMYTYYLIMSSFWAGSLHPLASRLLAEHYLWNNLQQESDRNVGVFSRVKRPPRGADKAMPPPAIDLNGGCAGADEGPESEERRVIT
ncbi:hypothetical protein BC827DRAFT_1226237 [Russula dissimulans]|nr:hypothetical protein BC827DRAFT_1226237 [Russula dissimulans]